MMELIILSNKYGIKTVLLDDDDYNLLSKYNWHFTTSNGKIFYAVRNIQLGPKKRTVIKMHRAILQLTERATVVDHIDGDGLNNQRSNLRVCTQGENVKNMRAKSSNKTGFKGVKYLKRIRKYMARITVNYEHIYLGVYHDPITAAQKYNEAATKYFGEFARLNKIA